MVVKTLVENTAVSNRFNTEHGLSLYIETGKYKLLCDLGASGLFLENAKKLGVNIKDIDFLVISHGHYDHGGGLREFLKHNKKAEVFVHHKAFNNYYSLRPDGSLKYIGLEAELKENRRLVFTADRFFIAEGIEVFSNVEGRALCSNANKTLLMEHENTTVEDIFLHEQNLVIREGECTTLFAGCSHRGIVNILNTFIGLKGRSLNYVFGGFHLYNPSLGQSEPKELINQVGEYLKNTGAVYYTGHCTGEEAYNTLKGVMGDSLLRLFTGSEIRLNTT